MAVVESSPYLKPAYSTARASIQITDPDVDLEDLAGAWNFGDDLVLRGAVEIHPSFLEQSGVADYRLLSAALVARCLSSRTSWREEIALHADPAGPVRGVCELRLDGALLASDAEVDVWIIGPGKLGYVGGDDRVHLGAKLWKMASPVKLQLEDNSMGFPTSAVSFRATHRRDVPWSVESPHEAAPEWSTSSAIRLYVNADSEVSRSLLDGDAEQMYYDAIQIDITQVVLQRLAGWREHTSPERMMVIAVEDPDTLAGLGAALVGRLGINLGEGLRLAAEDVSTLMARARESLQFGKVRA